MPIIRCVQCGYLTNTATSEHINRSDGQAERCFLRWREDDTPERGCAYEQAPEWLRKWVDKLIADERFLVRGVELPYGD